jgi:hypothetical protein
MVATNTWSASITKLSPSSLVSQFIGDSYHPASWGSHFLSEAKSMLFMKTAANISEMQTQGGVETEYGYFFDAFLKESHTGSVKITEHPVQSGANISDHAYNLPDKLTIEILVSDSMDCVVTNQFSEASTKSVSAYKTLRELKEKRMPLSVRTRLHNYKDMLIESMSVNDDYKSVSSMRCTVMLRQIIMAEVNAQAVDGNYNYAAETPSKNTGAGETPSDKSSVMTRIFRAFGAQ